MKLNPHLWDNILSAQNFNNLRVLPQINNNLDINTIDFCTNDYLGINNIPSIKKDIHNYLINLLNDNKIDIGATGSRLLSGNTSSHIKLEELISKTKGSESALIFNSGYQTNASVLTAILNKLDANKIKVFSDKANHASLHQAFKSLNIHQIRYHHNDLQHLEQRLSKHVQADDYVCIVTESIFGMDGDITNITELAKLAEKYNALLYIDEAHATGILGKNGYGLASNLFKIYPNTIVMGTFSKALGASGGYIACSNAIKNHLLNSCGGFIYSTAISPLIMEAVYYVWNLLHTPQFEDLRQQTATTSKYIRDNLINLGFDIGVSNSHIIPIILKDVEKSQKLYDILLKNNIKTSHIRPPTVAPNTARIRLSICANLSIKHTNKLLETIKLFSS
ncbi:MAG: 7-keto-8-aminopelargonate synthetase [Pseudomonadota bacterium]|jgi:8-amino-7-oxononanoate synthase